MNDRPPVDVAVVGAGIVGLAVAAELHSRYPNLSLAVVDRESAVAEHQTSHNSGVIHSGVYYVPGSLKAKLCVEGAALMYEYCERKNIPVERCGKLIVALSEQEIPALDEIERRGRENKVPDLRRIDAADIATIEPNCVGVAALHCPSTGIVDYGEVARSLEIDLRASGVTFYLGETVDGLDRVDGRTKVKTSHGVINAEMVVACAGLWSDRLAVAAGAPRDPQVVPFRGAYLTLESPAEGLVNGLIYPVPDPDLPFLGVHVTKHIDGRITLGPTAMMVLSRRGYRAARVSARDVASLARWPGSWRMARQWWRTGIDEIRTAMSRPRLLRAATRYVPSLSNAKLMPGTSAGVRAQALGRDGSLVDDFVISETPGALHVRNAPSPAATSSLALAKELVDRCERSTSFRWSNS